MSGDNGTPESRSPFDRLWAALRDTFSAFDSLTVETEQLTALGVCLIALPPAVTSLSQDESDVACSNLVLPSTTEFRVLTPSEASNFSSC